MYLLFSQLKKYLPDLTDGPKAAAAGFTKIGYMLDKFYEVEYQGQPDYLLDLEVRQNRADCFGVLGLARELSAYYNIPLVLPDFKSPTYSASNEAGISVEADKGVKRVIAVEIEGIKIGETEEWLKQYLEKYQINSINNLVDLTNYVMLETGHASHAFDRDLLESGKLTWKYPSQNTKFVTLAGEEVKIDPSILTISDSSKPVSLTFIGGKSVEINANTQNIILEMAVYEGGIVRQNSRKLNIFTEAGSRLEKYLDPETIPQAFDWLVSLIVENCGGTIVTKKTDIYLEPTKIEDIQLDMNKMRQIVGVRISNEEAEIILNRLGFQTVSQNGDVYTFKSASNRLDVTLEEDLIEEVIRIYGYDQVPVTNIAIESTDDITPRILGQIDTIALKLAANGFNEVRSWVLVSERDVNETESNINEVVKTTNSINEEVPYLRSNILMNLHGHFVKARKNNIKDVRLFEIGKVFRNINGEYTEHYSLGILRSGVSLNDVYGVVKSILSPILGTTNILMEPKNDTAKIMHPSNTYSLIAKNQVIGVVGVTSKIVTEEEFTFAEINLNLVSTLETQSLTSMEITSRVHDLDVNIAAETLSKAVETLTTKLESVKSNVYSWEVIDEFKNDVAEIYTFRISYINLTDIEAKELHSKLFE